MTQQTLATGGQTPSGINLPPPLTTVLFFSSSSPRPPGIPQVYIQMKWYTHTHRERERPGEEDEGLICVHGVCLGSVNIYIVYTYSIG
jgi:hypothetical protein